MRLYNGKGIFSNVEDDQQGLEQGLASQLTDVQTEIVGRCRALRRSSVARLRARPVQRTVHG